MTQQQPRPLPTQAGQFVIYKGRAAKPAADGSPHQFGKSANGNLEILVAMIIPELGATKTVPLSFSEKAAPFSRERLVIMGVEEKDIATLSGIDKNEVDVQAVVEHYDGKDRIKWQILTGAAGQFTTSNPISGREFAANLAAMTGKAPPNGGNFEKPPF